MGIANLELYKSLPRLKGACAQGSEKAFGQSYIVGMPRCGAAKNRFKQIVSCNTHGIIATLLAFVGQEFNTVEEADFVVVRRSEDLSNSERLVGANVVSRHRDKQMGTHHALDASDLLKEYAISIPMTSSDITTPSQLMHSMRFSIQLTPKFYETQKGLLEDVYQHFPQVSTIRDFNTNRIFELGRRYGFHGRLYASTIINSNYLLWDASTRRIRGWIFIPQEGATILSTIAAYIAECLDYQNGQIYNSIAQACTRVEW